MIEKMGELKLIATPQSFYCARIQWALKLKGVEYEFIEEDLLNKSPLLLKSNPAYKKVPTILYHGKPLAESLIILEYIDQVWKHYPLLPHDPSDKAIARSSAFADEKLYTVEVWEAFKSEGEKKEKAIKAAVESLATVEKQIEGKKFFGGEKIGYLDFVYGWLAHWLNVMEEVGSMKLLDKGSFPSLHHWCLNFINNPIIRKSIPSRENLVEYLKGSLRYHRALAGANKN
ncbi:glutathione transferase GST 23-like [Ziziphus jujuba]|uniref:Glutathione S-transferase n=1 Tax=Ziziphus jujuba TaxID=326968 RepID=A0ABM4A2L6_ZIZJJ|nr:glutathione transferase GST 23-like [Ziziphus jujuba]